jgi:hypothetical protein
MFVADVDAPGASDVWTRCYAYSVTHSTNVCAIAVACGKIYFSYRMSQSCSQSIFVLYGNVSAPYPGNLFKQNSTNIKVLTEELYQRVNLLVIF